MKRFLLSILAIAGLAVVSPPAGAASPIDCGAETSEAGVTICADPGLMWIDGVLAATSAAFNTANAGRNGRLRNLVSAQAGWSAIAATGARRPLVPRRHLCRPHQPGARPDRADPGRLQLQEDGSSILAEYPGPAAIPPMPRAFVAPEQLGLPGHWRGRLACGGRDTLLELTLEPGFPATLVGFIGCRTRIFRRTIRWSARNSRSSRGARRRRSRSSAAIASTASGPGFTFSTLEVALSPDGETLSGHIVEASCPEFALRRAEGSSVLAASIGLAQGRDWSWPYDPAARPKSLCGRLLRPVDRLGPPVRGPLRERRAGRRAGPRGHHGGRQHARRSRPRGAAGRPLRDPDAGPALGRSATSTARRALNNPARLARLRARLPHAAARRRGPGGDRGIPHGSRPAGRNTRRAGVEAAGLRRPRRGSGDARRLPARRALRRRGGAAAGDASARRYRGFRRDRRRRPATAARRTTPCRGRRAGSAGEGMEQLGALGTVLDVLAPAFAEMDEADVAELVAQVRGREDAVLEGEMARMTGATWCSPKRAS
ncbi:MAG: hypothetical protein WDN31_11850 [Hyphomicrobium sp.]